MDKEGKRALAITCEYEINEDLLNIISEDIGENVLLEKTYKRTTYYDNKSSFTPPDLDIKKFFERKLFDLGIDNENLIRKLGNTKTKNDIEKIIDDYKDTSNYDDLKTLDKFFENKNDWSSHPLKEYIARKYLTPYQPKFLYYDEYYALPSRISIEKLNSDQLVLEEEKTAKALFELADINIDDLLNSDDFEVYKAELEATQATISEELFEYWSTNKNLEIQFDIDKIEKKEPNQNQRIVEHVLDIRVRNNRARVSLQLKNRSKGFNWFFSFLVWFKKIQEDSVSNYILMLDEPGLNLHASAQSDLLDFIEHLSQKYQIIYTTHSPFMINPSKLIRVNTIVETQKGSKISNSIQEKDPNTLFPLQAALGYDIAQNLFVSKNNLLVEGVSDFIFLESLSGILQENSREYLRNDIIIVPAGGLDKVSTFVSLFRGNKLNIVCLLDSSIDVGSKNKIENLVKQKIIKSNNIVFYHEFIDNCSEADIEDVFIKKDYLNLFNNAFNEYENIKESDLNPDIHRIVLQINHKLGIERFNHYRPANQLARTGVTNNTFDETTLTRFETIFRKINRLFG